MKSPELAQQPVARQRRIREVANPVQLNDIWRCEVACYNTTNAQVSLNRYLFLCEAVAGTGGTDAQLATALDTLFAVEYKQAIANVAVYYGVKVSRYLLPAVNRPAISIANTGAGTGGADQAPSVVCGLIKLTTTANGRKGQGRVYMPFVPTAYMTINGEPTAAYEVVLDGLATAVLGLAPVGAGGNTSTLKWVLPAAKTVPATALVATALAEGKFGTQHRRGDYGKLNVIPPF
jgi:hypothetical protein